MANTNASSAGYPSSTTSCRTPQSRYVGVPTGAMAGSFSTATTSVRRSRASLIVTVSVALTGSRVAAFAPAFASSATVGAR